MVEMEPDPPVADPTASTSTNGSGVEEDASAPKSSSQRRKSRLSVPSFPRGFFSSLRRRKVVSSGDQPTQDGDPAEEAAAPAEDQAASNASRKSRSLSLSSFRLRRNVNRPKSVIENEPHPPAPSKGKAHKDRRSAPALSPSTPTDQEAIPSTSDAPVDVAAKEEVVAGQVADKKKKTKGKSSAAKSEAAADAEHSKTEETPAAAKNTKSKTKLKSTEIPATASTSRDPLSETTAAGESPAVNEQPVKSKERMTSLRRDFFSSFRRKKSQPLAEESPTTAAAGQENADENPAGTMKTSRSLSLNSLRLKKGVKTQNKIKPPTQLAVPQAAASVSLVTLVDMGTSQTDLATESAEATDAPAAEGNAPPTPQKEIIPAESVTDTAAESAPAPKEKPRERFLLSLRRKKKTQSIEIPSANESGQAEASANEAPLLTPQPPKPSAANKKFGRSFSFNSFRLKKKTNKANELKVPENTVGKSSSAVTLVSMDDVDANPAESENPAPADRSPHVKFKGQDSEAAEGAKTSADATDGEGKKSTRLSSDSASSAAPFFHLPKRESPSKKVDQSQMAGAGRVSPGILKTSKSKKANQWDGAQGQAAPFGGKLKMGSSIFTRDSLRLIKRVGAVETAADQPASSQSLHVTLEKEEQLPSVIHEVGEESTTRLPLTVIDAHSHRIQPYLTCW